MGNNKSSQKETEEMVGFRVKEIKKLSPAAKCGLMLSSDYVLSAGGKTLRNMEPAAIAELIKANENKELHLKVFNENTSKIRDVVIVPSRDWPGEGLMGVVLRLEKYDPYSRTSTGDFNITFDDVYTKDNPIARKSTSRSPNPKSPKKGPEDNVVNGNNAFYQNSPGPAGNSPRRQSSNPSPAAGTGAGAGANGKRRSTAQNVEAL